MMNIFIFHTTLSLFFFYIENMGLSHFIFGNIIDDIAVIYDLLWHVKMLYIEYLFSILLECGFDIR